MPKLNLKSNEGEPRIQFNDLSQCLKITGRSLMENPKSWYEKLSSEINLHLSQGKISKLSLFFEYFNTASAKQIYQLIKTSKSLNENLIIEWVYEHEDEDMLESGEDYQEMCGFEFEFKEIN